MKNCIICKKILPLDCFGFKKVNEKILKKSCEICLVRLQKRINGHTYKTGKDFEFSVNLNHTGCCDIEMFRMYINAEMYNRYSLYLRLLSNKVRAQLKSDLRIGLYTFQEIIDSGQLDEMGSLIPSEMLKIRMELI